MPTANEPELPINLALLALPDDELHPLLGRRDELTQTIAADLDIVRAGLVRRVADQIDVRRLITWNASTGMPPGSIAALLGMTESYVYRVIREAAQEPPSPELAAFVADHKSLRAAERAKLAAKAAKIAEAAKAAEAKAAEGQTE